MATAHLCKYELLGYARTLGVRIRNTKVCVCRTRRMIHVTSPWDVAPAIIAWSRRLTATLEVQGVSKRWLKKLRLRKD